MSSENNRRADRIFLNAPFNDFAWLIHRIYRLTSRGVPGTVLTNGCTF
jgi:hypothetical protein